MSIIFKQAVWEEAVRRSLVAVGRAGSEQEVSRQVSACRWSGSRGNCGAEKEKKLLRCVSWEEAVAAAWGWSTDTPSPPLFASKPVPVMKVSGFCCSNTAAKATSRHRNSRGVELQLGTVPCSSATVTVPSCWTAPALRAAGADISPRQRLQRCVANAGDVTAEGV